MCTEEGTGNSESEAVDIDGDVAGTDETEVTIVEDEFEAAVDVIECTVELADAVGELAVELEVAPDVVVADGAVGEVAELVVTVEFGAVGEVVELVTVELGAVGEVAELVTVEFGAVGEVVELVTVEFGAVGEVVVELEDAPDVIVTDGDAGTTGLVITKDVNDIEDIVKLADIVSELVELDIGIDGDVTVDIMDEKTGVSTQRSNENTA